MKVRKPSVRLTDIGELDHALRLPMAPRILAGMKSTCVRCGKQITNEFFIAGFKKGHPNMLIHEACVPSDDPAIMAMESGIGGAV